MENFNFDYDVEADDLFIYLENKKSAGAIELGNFILDFDKEGYLMAIQITNASTTLSKILSKIIQLNKIREITVNSINFRNMDAIKFRIKTDTQEETATILIPHIKEKSPVLQY